MNWIYYHHLSLKRCIFIIFIYASLLVYLKYRFTTRNVFQKDAANLNLIKIFVSSSSSTYEEQKMFGDDVERIRSQPILAPNNSGPSELHKLQVNVDNNISLKHQSREETVVSWMTRIHWQSKQDYHSHKFLINPRKKCETKGNLTLLVLLKSAPKNSQKRDMVRNTYMQGTAKYNVSCRIFFLLGLPAADEELKVQAEIVKESETHDDIIQADFRDSYYNLTTKLILAFKWTTIFCNNSGFVMSADDDVMLDIVTLVDDLEDIWKASVRPLSNFVLGQETYNRGPIRNPKSKWYTSVKMYPADKFPTYPQGHGYIMSRDVVPKVYRASRRLPPPVPWDDVYVGMLLDKINVSLVDRVPWYLERHPLRPVEAGNLLPLNDYLTIRSSVKRMTTIWNEMEREIIGSKNTTQ